LIVGLDTSTPITSVAIHGDDMERELHDEGERPRHAQTLLPLLEQAVPAWDTVERLCVGVGPGGFTGLRIGVATARALATSTGAELRPVSSLRSLARGMGSDPLSLPLIDARRGEVFAALYQSPDLEEVWAPFAARPEEVAERVREAGFTPVAAGTGALPFRGTLEAAGIHVLPDASSAHSVTALQVCRLAVDAPAAPPGAVLPDYLRQPDAKPRSE
jgi:tRNA threonylcarbamoyladenosine biosynthesis protein TsaB